MRITVEDWERLSNRLSTVEAAPPNAVYLAILALVDKEEISGSLAESESSETVTIWRNWVVTSRLLAHTEIEFAVDGYDQAAEDMAYQRNPDHYVATDIRQAWVRPLSSVVALSYSSVGPKVISRHFGAEQGDWFAVGDFRLKFTDNVEVVVPGQQRTHRTERELSDRFVAAIRAGIPF